MASIGLLRRLQNITPAWNARKIVPRKLCELFSFKFKFTFFKLPDSKERKELTHCAGKTALMVFMKQIGRFSLIQYTSLQLCTAQHSGEQVLHLKRVSPFPSLFFNGQWNGGKDTFQLKKTDDLKFSSNLEPGLTSEGRSFILSHL